MKTLLITAGFGLLAMAAPAMADAKLFPYPAANYCPAGLQPIQLGGVICCGVPNQGVTYSQYQAHPAPRRKVYRTPVYQYRDPKSPDYMDPKSPRG